MVKVAYGTVLWFIGLSLVILFSVGSFSSVTKTVNDISKQFTITLYADNGEVIKSFITDKNGLQATGGIYSFVDVEGKTIILSGTCIAIK